MLNSKVFSRAMAAALCCLALFAACKDTGSGSTSVLMAAPPQAAPTLAGEDSSLLEAEDAQPPQDEPIALQTVATSLGGSFAGSETGCYTTTGFSDGSLNIHYYDYAAAEMRLLESPAPTEGLHGQVADAWSGAVPVFAGGRLFLFRLGGPEQVLAYGPNAAPAVLRMDADGSGLFQTLLPSTYTFHLSSAILWDGSALYFLMWDHTQEDASEQVLVKLDADTLEMTELHRLPADSEYSIEGHWEMGPLMVAADTLPPVSDPAFNAAWESRAFRLLAFGLNSGQETHRGGWTQGETNTVQGNLLYYWAQDTHEMWVYNADSDEHALVAADFAPAGYEHAYIQRAVYDGRVSIQFSVYGGTSISYFTVDAATGQAAKTAITPYDNVTICAEGPDAFLVRYGDKWVNREKVQPDYEPGVTSVDSATPGFVSVPEYALVAKADFWAGERNFVPIKDLVYG